LCKIRLRRKVARGRVAHLWVHRRQHVFVVERKEETVQEEAVEVPEQHADVVGFHGAQASLVSFRRMESGGADLFEQRQQRPQKSLQQQRRIQHEEQLHSGAEAFVAQEALQERRPGSRIADEHDGARCASSAQPRKKHPVDRHGHPYEKAQPAIKQGNDEWDNPDSVRPS
jgi:hypothetical protein